MILRFLSWLTFRDPQVEFVVAQHREIQRQIPFIYMSLIANSAALGFTRHGHAPPLLTVWIPAALCLVCGLRLLRWVRAARVEPDVASMVSDFRYLNLRTVALAVSHLAWAIALGHYGSAYEQGQVALFVAITLATCMFCLMHVPQAVVVVMACAVVPFTLYYVAVGDPVLSVVAVNLFFVTTVVAKVAFNSFASFERLVRSQLQAERLGAENARLANTDSLTGLPNRRFFLSEIDRWIARFDSEGAATPFAVGTLDLDRFKPVNDTYGHLVGDGLLALVGQRLADMSGPNTVIARLGGDEFGFITTEHAADAEGFAQRLCDTLALPYRVQDLDIAIGCSCGVALYPVAGRTPHDLFDRSDYALYFCKQTRRGTAVLYSAEHERHVRAERAMEIALQGANAGREFSVHLQPIVDTRQGGVAAFECLARWNSPTLGDVRPDVFIAAAERSGSIHQLTLLLLRTALGDFAALPGGVGLSFNLSAQDLVSPQTMLSVLSIVRESGIAPKRIIFEITETALMRDYDVAQHSIRLLRSLGCRVALDDFGTGYSNLGYLHRLEIDRIKIDRSFVRDLGHPAGRKLIASIVRLSQALELECVVEGVERPDQLAVLKTLGCHLFQGFLFSPPLHPADANRWIEAQASETPLALPAPQSAAG